MSREETSLLVAAISLDRALDIPSVRLSREPTPRLIADASEVSAEALTDSSVDRSASSAAILVSREETSVLVAAISDARADETEST